MFPEVQAICEHYLVVYGIDGNCGGTYATEGEKKSTGSLVTLFAQKYLGHAEDMDYSHLKVRLLNSGISPKYVP